MGWTKNSVRLEPLGRKKPSLEKIHLHNKDSLQSLRDEKRGLKGNHVASGSRIVGSEKARRVC